MFLDSVVKTVTKVNHVLSYLFIGFINSIQKPKCIQQDHDLRGKLWRKKSKENKDDTKLLFDFRILKAFTLFLHEIHGRVT